MEEETDKSETSSGLTFMNVSPCDLLQGVSKNDLPQSGSKNEYSTVESHYSKQKDVGAIRNKGKSKRYGSVVYKKRLYSSVLEEKRLRTVVNTGDILDVERLLDSCPDIDINACDDKLRTALHFASARGKDDIVHCLLQNGADPNVRDTNGNSPLHLVACTHHIRVITLLLRYGAEVKAVDHLGQTPLHLAISRLKILNSHEPVITYKGRDFKSPYLTQKRKAEVSDIVAMLREFFEKSGKQDEHSKMCDIESKLKTVSLDSEVDEIGAMLTNFTQMSLDKIKQD